MGRFDSRYWDGAAWTRAVMRDGRVDTDSEDPPSDGEAEMSANPTHKQVSHRASADGAAHDPSATAVPGGAGSGLDRFTSLSAPDAQARIVQLLPIGGFTVIDNSPGYVAATVDVDEEPNWVVVIALCFLWLVPGLIYWYLKSRPTPRRLALQLLPAELGTRISILGEAPALERLAPVLAQLPW